MKQSFRALALVAALATPVVAAQAMDTVAYKTQVEETIREVISGNFPSIDKTLARQDEIIKIGVEGAREFAVDKPEYAKLMQLTIANVDTMKKMELEQLEAQWGDGAEAFKAAGFDITKLSQFSAARSHADTIIHPTTSFVLLSLYKKTGDKALLEQAKSELVEVLEHLQHLN
jgi:hypothetical protein